jgi:hypothetical protein
LPAWWQTVKVGRVKRDHGVYVGRHYDARWTAFDEETWSIIEATETLQSPLGNPFFLARDATPEQREAVVLKYKVWLKDRMRRWDASVLGELARLAHIARRDKHITLLCWCRTTGQTPGPHNACHADVIADALRWVLGWPKP